MKIALASLPFPKSIDDGLFWVEKFIKEASEKKVDIICFPESYIPGMRGIGIEVEEHSPQKLKSALEKICTFASLYSINVIIPMDWDDYRGILNIAYVISDKGEIMGYQTKNQLDPIEDNIFIPGTTRSIFEIKGVKFGISICHEGFKYPESVRWAAIRGAKIVFHPHCTGSNSNGKKFVEWGHQNNTYHEKALMLRAIENNIYFASVNYKMQYQEAATCLIGPDGQCIAYEAYGNIGILIANIDIEKATGELANRFRPELYID